AVRGESVAQVRHPPGARRRVVDAPAAEARGVRQGSTGQKAFLGQPFEADEQRVSRERGVRAVRRVAVPERPDRQHLPPALPYAVQQAREGVRLRSQITAPVRTGERRQMEQDTACPLAEIEGHPCPYRGTRKRLPGTTGGCLYRESGHLGAPLPAGMRFATADVTFPVPHVLRMGRQGAVQTSKECNGYWYREVVQ